MKTKIFEQKEFWHSIDLENFGSLKKIHKFWIP